MTDTPDNTPGNQPEESMNLKGLMHFHLVLAEVIFRTEHAGIQSHRTQFITQSPINHFPADRIRQLQNSAAHSIKRELDKKSQRGFQVYDVLLHALTYCGQMTSDEFYGPGVTTKTVPETADTSTAVKKVDMSGNQEASQEDVARGENVVSLNRDSD